MRKLLLITLLLTFFVGQGQSLSETIDWLNQQKGNIKGTEGTGIKRKDNATIIFTEDYVSLEYNDIKNKIQWSEVVFTSVDRVKGYEGINLISNAVNPANKKKVYATFYFPENKSMLERFNKAINHVLDLKKANLKEYKLNSLENAIEYLNIMSVFTYTSFDDSAVKYSNSGVQLYFYKKNTQWEYKYNEIIKYSIEKEDGNWFPIKITEKTSANGKNYSLTIYAHKTIAEKYYKAFVYVLEKGGAKKYKENLF